MKLISINIKNFRSLEDVTFYIDSVDGGYTYSLIGINESGKSSFLKAISAVLNEEEIVYDRDFTSPNLPIIVTLNYKLTTEEQDNLSDKLMEFDFDAELTGLVKIQNISICAKFEPVPNSQRRVYEQVSLEKNIIDEYTLQNEKPVRKDPEQQEQESLNLEKFFQNSLPKYFRTLAHHIVFWKSESKYLITERINLTNFASSLENISIPLVNCFALAGINKANISGCINRLQDNPAEINNLAEKLGDSVTAHIQKIWKNHPIKIKFQISFPLLSFLVEDNKVKYQAKTTAQRSDGFRQFLSFLLTISAESATNNLSNTLLLIDEPETHLHPKAQEYLMEELIEITRGDDNNVVLFATHSNHMIDKDQIGRCFRVSKNENDKTIIGIIELGKTTYAEVNYEVFDIIDSDYHNELYGYLEAEHKVALKNLPLEKTWWNDKKKDKEKVSLPTYIRHAIHHPENTKNKRFTEEELKKSIEILRELKRENTELKTV